VKFGVEEWTTRNFTLIGATSPLPGEKPQNRRVSNLNTGSVRAMLPV